MANGTKIAQAYVEIVPVTEGISDNISSELSGVDKQFSIAGIACGTAFGGALEKIVSSVVTTIASMAVNTLKSSIEASAEFEQLAGGMEKIFSGMDTTTIMNDAKNAYKDLGMSINDYLGKINDVGATFKATMGDREGYETARRGLMAISDYATGTGKDIETLSEKFTMITRSTSSYQSIADQFSGILPATSQAFLEQAKACGDLSSNYSKLTDVPIAEYQKAVASALERGVEALNLTGNTAKEASSTLSGSITQMKKAWENFLLSLTSADIDSEEMTSKLIQAFKDVITNLAPLIEEFAPALAEALTTAFIELTPVLMEVMSEVFISVMKKMPDILARYGQLMWKQAFSSMDIAGSMNEAGNEMLMALVSSLDNCGKVVGNWAKDMYDSGKESIQNFAKGIVDSFKEVINNLKESGKEMATGLVNGFVEKITALRDKVLNAVNGVVDKIKNLLGIHSPSRLFRDEIGAMMAQGLEIGWSNEMQRFNTNLEGDISSTLDVANKELYSSINGQTTSAPTTKTDLASELAKAIANITVQSNVTLEGDAGKLFTVMQGQNRIYKNSTGRSAFA